MTTMTITIKGDEKTKDKKKTKIIAEYSRKEHSTGNSMERNIMTSCRLWTAPLCLPARGAPEARCFQFPLGRRQGQEDCDLHLSLTPHSLTLRRAAAHCS